MRSWSVLRMCAAWVVLLASIPAGPARADLWPPAPPRARPRVPRAYREARPREPWEEYRLLIGGGAGFPFTFPAGWQTGAGWSAGIMKAVQPWADVVFDVEDFTLHFDDSELRSRGATSITSGRASFGDGALGFHLHGSFTGRRLYGVAQAALPAVSRPVVRYADARGTHEQSGTEIFAIDPGLVLGMGYEYNEPRRVGGFLESRLVIAPGRTKPTEILFVLRAGFSLAP